MGFDINQRLPKKANRISSDLMDKIWKSSVSFLGVRVLIYIKTHNKKEIDLYQNT